MAIGKDVLSGIGGYDPRARRLVQAITAKTRERKIVWSKTSTVLLAAAPGGMQLSFVFNPSMLSFVSGIDWELFTIRDSSGNEILKVQNEKPPILPLTPAQVPGASTKEPVVDAVDELFRTVGERAKDDIDKAIDLIDKM
jgi:hypothetical protein